MPSEKLVRILQSKSHLSPQQIDAMSDAEGWDWVYANASPRKERLPSICFTGFPQAEKDELTALAVGARFRIVPSVTGSLAFLCTGDHAGPSKLAKAVQFGISILDRAQFAHLLETGEVPPRQPGA